MFVPLARKPLEIGEPDFHLSIASPGSAGECKKASNVFVFRNEVKAMDMLLLGTQQYNAVVYLFTDCKEGRACFFHKLILHEKSACSFCVAL